jgi:hypothetical protein
MLSGAAVRLLGMSVVHWQRFVGGVLRGADADVAVTCTGKHCCHRGTYTVVRMLHIRTWHAVFISCPRQGCNHWSYSSVNLVTLN